MKYINIGNAKWAVAGFLALQTTLAIALTPIPGGPVPLSPEINPIPILPVIPDLDIILPPFIFSFDAKVFHGSECQPVHGNQTSDFKYYNNRIYNAGSGTRYVTCPIVRDNTVNTSGTFGTEVYVRNVASHKLSCTLYSWSPHGVLVAANSKSTPNNGNQTLRPDVNLSKNMGSYNLYCRLPKGASIYSYKVKEWLNGSKNRTDWFN